MSIFEDTNPRALKELLGQIEAREAVLPDFQRDFVWDPNATAELIVSVAANYPAGSLLRIRNTYNLFACREFQGAPPLNGNRPTYLVLDGQQRLTSLYQAFYGVGEHRYYLDLKRLLAGDDFEECIFHVRAKDRRVQQYERPEVQATDLILPLSVLKGGAGDFGRWSRRVARQAPTDTDRIQLEDALDQLEEKWIRTIDDYHFPVVTLSDSTGAEAVCTIFETLNRTGVKLSPFELLTARFWPKGVNLRQRWAEARDRFPIIADFGIDPYYLLQVIALVARPTPSCKRSDVLDLTAGAIETWWPRATAGLARGLELLRDDCGVATPAWLPYGTLVIPLAAVLATVETTSSPAVGANRQKLARWFWCSVFGQAYENAPNSQAARDVGELLGWLGGGEPPETVRSFAFDPQVLRDTTVRQRALYRGCFCLVFRRGPRDFHNGARLTGDLMIEHNVDDHHVFPQAYLAKRGVEARARDCVLNRTLIDRKTNIRISDRAPSKYMAEIRQALGDETFAALLDSHLLPGDADSPLWSDDFDGFIARRQEAIWREIQRVTGLAATPPAVPTTSPADHQAGALAADAHDWVSTAAAELEDEADNGPLSEFEIIYWWAHRFDGYGYVERTGLDYQQMLDAFYTTGQWPGSRLDHLATLCMMERAFKWAGMDLEPQHGRYWRAFRSLFLLTYDYEVPLEHRDIEQYAEWERRLAPRAAEYVEAVCRIHDTTAYDDDAPPAPAFTVVQSSSLTPLVDRQEIAEAWALLQDAMRGGSEQLQRKVGWPGGNGDFTLYWHADQGVWGVLEPDFASGRYWFGLGTEDPRPVRMVSLVCEINPPVEGINRRCAGLFVRDADGVIYLTHSGRVGGGRPGIGKREFVASYNGGDIRPIQWPDGRVTEAFVIGPVGSDALPARIAHFVHEVERFKQATAQGRA